MAIVAVSLKMYFDTEQTLTYCSAIAQSQRTLELLNEGTVRLAVFPSYLAIPGAAGILAGTPVLLGGQNLCAESRGAFTGEVSGADLKAAGCQVVEIGHAERRRLFAETDLVVAQKVQTARANQLTPLLCIGEPERTDPKTAAARCIAQVRAAVGTAEGSELWLAYEPIWAIGAAEPAPADYVRAVCEGIRAGLKDLPGLAVLYGGSAGPGLLSRLGTSVDGVFLGRFAHNPAALLAVVDEAAQLSLTI